MRGKKEEWEREREWQRGDGRKRVERVDGKEREGSESGKAEWGRELF